VSPVRPDLVACWLFRLDDAGRPEILLIRRAPDRPYPGQWQPVTGRLEPDERVTAAALREVAEETGLSGDDIEAFLRTDIIDWFHEPAVDAIVSMAIFAARVRATVVPRLSNEHTDARWVSPDEARDLLVWPSERAVVGQIEWLVENPEKSSVYRLVDSES
jgi:8-oxo-dGTP pyrophosphatase MutT (NUDIX family)